MILCFAFNSIKHKLHGNVEISKEIIKGGEYFLDKIPVNKDLNVIQSKLYIIISKGTVCCQI